MHCNESMLDSLGSCMSTRRRKRRHLVIRAWLLPLRTALAKALTAQAQSTLGTSGKGKITMTDDIFHEILVSAFFLFGNL